MKSRIFEKIRNGGIKDPKKEELRIKMIRTLAYLSKTYAGIGFIASNPSSDRHMYSNIIT